VNIPVDLPMGLFPESTYRGLQLTCADASSPMCYVMTRDISTRGRATA